jgi:tol-pal system protein YbgF
MGHGDAAGQGHSTMKRVIALVPVLAALAGCATNPADDPVQVRLNDIDARVGKVERVITNQSLLELSRRIDSLESQLRELRGNTEVLQNGADGLKRQQRDLYADLDRRIAALEAGLKAGAAGGGTNGAGTTGAGTTGAGAPAAGAPAATAAEPADDQSTYARALEQLKARDYAGAIARLQALMGSYPQSSLVDNAQYWIGEAYYAENDLDHAAAAFRAVGERWPNSRKAGDALLKLGYTQIEQKHLSEARATLGQVVQRFPGSDAARLAADKLSKLTAESH